MKTIREPEEDMAEEVRPRPFRPLRALLRLILFAGLTVACLVGIAMLVARTGAFREMAEERASVVLGGTVTLGGLRLTPGFSLEARDVRLSHEPSGAGGDAARIRLCVDWERSRRAKALIYGRLEVEEAELTVRDLVDGSREPARLLAPAGLASVETSGSSESEPPGLFPTTVVRMGEAVKFQVEGLRVNWLDPEETPRMEWTEGRLGVDPGTDATGVVPSFPRVSFHGRIRLLHPERAFEALNVEAIRVEGEWRALVFRVPEPARRRLGPWGRLRVWDGVEGSGNGVGGGE